MNFKIDKKCPIPYHSQIEEYIRTLIKKSEYKTEKKLLPNEVTLAKKLGVSRSTVRQATNKLVQEGLIERIKGVGPKVVTTKTISSSLENWISFINEMKSQGIEVVTSMLKFNLVNADDEVYNALAIKEKCKIWKLEKIQGTKVAKILYTISYFHPRVGFTGKENMLLPLYEMMENTHDVIVNTSKEKIFAIQGDQKILDMLEVDKNIPLLKRERLVLDIADKPIQYNIVYYRSDFFSYKIDIQRF